VIGGTTRPAVDGARLTSVDPVTGEPWAEAADSGAADVDDACAAAVEAFRGWRRTTPRERMDALLAAADLLAAHADELGALEVRDTGKPQQVVDTDEIPPTLDQVRFFAGAARMLEGRAVGEYEEGLTSGVRREPVGVCGAITPWNYPFMMAAWKWAPAIAAGNTMVLKPSELTPASTVRTAELLAGVLPPGVLNVVCGGPGAGAALAAHPSVAQVSLTGSVRAGRAVAGRGGRPAGPHPPRARRQRPRRGLRRRRRGRRGRGHRGRCLPQRRPGLHRGGPGAGPPGRGVGLRGRAGRGGRADRRRRPGAARCRARPAHQCRAPGQGRGPARPAAGPRGGRDRRQAAAAPGLVPAATVVVGVEQQDEIVQTEIFGPVVTVQVFGDEDEALTLANGVDHGLTASVWTT
jgi:betaine-aldehyde dehydrogenase